ncbi:MAG: hypothetical protein K6F93_05410 [Lachnospiraceae bacterium]|nr:hypothetical protein [Lachnospiraceae bacterium]
MKRFGNFLLTKCAALLLTALFVVNMTLLAGCSGFFGESAEKSGEYTLSDNRQNTNASGEKEEGTLKAETTKNVSDEKETPNGITEEKIQPANESTDVEEKADTLENSEIEDKKANEADPEEVSEDDSKEDAKETSPKGAPSQSDPAWKDSFLLFMPVFEGGITQGRTCEETFDHILIGDVSSKRKVEDYVEEVKKAGFNVEADYVDHNGDIDFHAYNDEGWYAIVDYNIAESSIDIGCGFFKEEKEKGPEMYFGEEMLEVLPMPDAGVLSTGKQDADLPYALYEGCTLEDARAYAKKLEKAGFDKNVIKGDSDNQCWYNATGPKGYICDMQYADGIIMIGCDKAEEE